MEPKYMKINIIDTTSTEFNRGSFCYAPYLCYNGLKERGYDVHLFETVRPEDLDTIPDADIQVVTLWSYPQIESAFLFAHFLPFTYGKDNVYFVGYRPLIEELGLRYIDKVLAIDPMQDVDFLKKAMFSYPKYYQDFKRLLLSDCDMHLQSLEKGEKVYPLFTTYGCPNGCSFCPSTVNCGRKRIQLSEEQTVSLLLDCSIRGIKYIHLTDEDFFFNIERAFSILTAISGLGFHLIALGSAKKVKNFIDKYGTDVIRQSGLEVIEIGFESASETMSHSMGAGKSLTDCEALAEMQHTLPCRIFWLVMTFFPGETIHTLNETGRFMQKYGFNENEVVGRLRTNGTKGGLGQFFQVYTGTPMEGLEENGRQLTARPIRLIPSYIPDSFVGSKINRIHLEKLAEAEPWLRLYNVLGEVTLEDLTNCERTFIDDFFIGCSINKRIRRAIYFAILARMEVIE